MADVTLRLVKGNPLTYAEVDNNFTNLNDATGHFKNRLINGNFDFWQRGTSFAYTSGAQYTADRWRSFAGGSAVGTISRQAFALGQTDVPGEPRFFFRNNRTTASTVTNFPVSQRVESVRTLAGQTVTWSFWAKVGSGTKNLSPGIHQNFGTGGSPSSSVFVLASAITVTTTWQKFSTTFNVPSISGKTIGTDENDFLSFEVFEESPFSTFTLDFAQSQVEKGSQATEFEFRPFQTELALCQRYFQKTYNLSDAPGTAELLGAGTEFASVTTATIRPLFRPLTTTMRTIPTVTWYSPTTGASGNIRVDAADVAVSAVINRGQSAYGYPQTVSGVGAGSAVTAQITAEAEL